MTRNILAFVLLSLAASPFATAKERPGLGENARLWLNFVEVLAVDSQKPKSHVEYLDVTPGQRKLTLMSTHFGGTSTIYTRFQLLTTLEPGHTYAVRYDQRELGLVFNDLGKDFVIPKLGMIYTSKAYRQALADASTKPTHRVALIPRSEWEK
jgi:hypothetical protein